MSYTTLSQGHPLQVAIQLRQFLSWPIGYVIMNSCIMQQLSAKGGNILSLTVGHVVIINSCIIQQLSAKVSKYMYQYNWVDATTLPLLVIMNSWIVLQFSAKVSKYRYQYNWVNNTILPLLVTHSAEFSIIPHSVPEKY